MIVRRDVFDEDHRPTRLLHRESETDLLLEALDPGTDGSHRGHAVLSGSSGVGKTVLSKQCVERLRERRGTIDAHVRCLDVAPGSIYRRTIESFQRGPDDVPRTEPVADVLAMLEEIVADADPAGVVILDEADDIARDAVDTLSSMAGLSVVVICHEPERWFSRLDPGVRDRFTAGTHIPLDRFSVSELADILQRRAEAGLRRDAWSRAQLEAIADHQAGVARDAIQSLRAAAEVADERGHDEIHDADIERGYELAKRDIRKANIRSLPFAYQFLYELIRVYGPVSSSRLYDLADAHQDDVWNERPSRPPSTNRTRRNQLAKLREYDLIETQNNVHEACDSSIEPSVEIRLSKKTL
ncbi:AAA family ATPase [Natronomonas halophila]|uniref:Cdc6/Cdc18 family protein n=1 Tax=Natronomonas halophila TaxID=2747817 RepID=UPI0015B6FE83|nr:AAA family ATPase [Natronomonas halophila]QLD84600.1 AAA family ATPase [Natronomonas halophila]QLD84656.1 AAA family ATPase [Natronomonas halophila]